MTGSGTLPAVDPRRVAAEFTRALMSESTAVVAALMDRADVDAAYRRGWRWAI